MCVGVCGQTDELLRAHGTWRCIDMDTGWHRHKLALTCVFPLARAASGPDARRIAPRRWPTARVMLVRLRASSEATVRGGSSGKTAAADPSVMVSAARLPPQTPKTVGPLKPCCVVFECSTDDDLDKGLVTQGNTRQTLHVGDRCRGFRRRLLWIQTESHELRVQSTTLRDLRATYLRALPRRGV